jgi:cytidine deaminase
LSDSDSTRRPKPPGERPDGAGAAKRWPESERREGTDRRAAAERRRRTVHNEALADRYNPADRRRTDRRSGKDRRDEEAWAALPLEASADESTGEASLVLAAVDARTRAHAQYSGFKVGAALETSGGEIVTGCNIENATYGLTLCAERVALVKALSDGREIFTRIAVVADTPDPTPPCGPCRQLLWEYCGDIEIVLANLSGPTARLRLSALLPMPFDNRLLE